MNRRLFIRCQLCILAALHFLIAQKATAAASSSPSTPVPNPGVANVADVPALLRLAPPPSHGSALLQNYHQNAQVGGGALFWDDTYPKAKHNGGSVIDPQKKFPTRWDDNAELEAWFTPASSGYGCWRRNPEHHLVLEDFGARGDGAVDDSWPCKAAFKSETAYLSGLEGATYLVSDVIVSKETKFDGNVTFKKKNFDRAIFSILTGPYNVSFSNTQFDGNWTSGYGKPDIYVQSSSKDGLDLAFKNCTFKNCSQYALSTDYVSRKATKRILLDQCKSNGTGAFKSQSRSETVAALISVNYVQLLEINSCDFQGDGIFDFGDGTQAGLVRAPALTVIATFTKVHIKGTNFKSSGGISLYTGCDNSLVEESTFRNCLYAVSAQEGLSPSIINCSIQATRAPYRGAITIQPYARLNSSVGRKMENISGGLIEKCTFQDNEIDISLVGVWALSNRYGVINTRCRGIRINDCTSERSIQRPVVIQDADDVEFNRFTVRSPCQSNSVANFGKIFLITSTSPSGNGTIKINDGEISAIGGKSIQFISSINLAAAAPEMRIIIHNTRFSGFKQSQLPIVDVSFADTLDMTANTFNGISVRQDNLSHTIRRVILKNNK